MTHLSRRSLLGAGLAAVAVAAIDVLPAQAGRKVHPHKGAVPFGNLTSIVDGGRLALPAGFTASRISTVGVEPLLADRYGAKVGVTPSTLDGTGCFEVGNSIRLVRNHENRADVDHTVPLVDGTVYDAGCATGMGGVTVVELSRSGRFIQQWVGLSGCIRNCAGGETPWGSWLSCEEDTSRAGATVKNAKGETSTLQQDHGYIFEVFPDVVAKQCPMPIKAWGRAVFEGASIGPDRKSAYLTEDAADGLFYRWTAPHGTVIKPYIARQFDENDGVLQAAQLVRNGIALRHYGELTADDLGKAYPVRWVDGGADRQAQRSDLRKQFPGATVHHKVEGCWSDGKGLFFTLSYVDAKDATKYGIDEDWGMIMYYDFKAQTLTMKEYFPAGNSLGAIVPGDDTEAIKQFNGPDNITVSPFGTVMMCEDGDNPCSLISWTPRSGSQEFARDLADRGEWAGPAFTRRGDILFASVQSDCTYAITGPFKKYLTSNGRMK